MRRHSAPVFMLGAIMIVMFVAMLAFAVVWMWLNWSVM